MIFKFITQCWKKRFFRSIVRVLIFTFTITSCGCYSSYNGSIKPEILTSSSTYTFVKAIMKNGLIINLENKDAVYERSLNAIIYTLSEDYSDSVNSKVNSTAPGTGILKVKDIQSLIVEKDEFDAAGSIMVTLAVIAGIVLVALIILIAIAGSSCPFIYSFNGEKYVFDAEPYGGSVAEGLKKTDYSRLEELKAADSKYKLIMRNVTDETQYTDEMKLLVIEHPVSTEVAPDISGKFTVFGKVLPPVSVTEENGKDIAVFFKSKDNIQWQTDMPVGTGFDSKNLKHELIFKFPKPPNAKSAKLLINTGTAQWGEFMIKKMLEYRGDKVDLWYEDINRKGKELLKLYQFVEREELFIMKANILEDNKWVTRGTVSAGGPYIDEDRIVELSLENVTGDTVYIKLCPPYGYWKFDYAGIIYESNFNAEIKELPLSYAKNEKDQDLRDSMLSIDGKYYSMPDTTSSAYLEFDVPPLNVDMNRSLYLKTTGYYDIHLKKDKPEQTELIEKIYNTPGLILELTMNEYIEKIKSLGILNK